MPPGLTCTKMSVQASFRMRLRVGCVAALRTDRPGVERRTPCQVSTYTMHHAPCTMHHAPCTMHHAPCTMHHAPYTIPAYDTAKSVHKDTPPPLLLPICLEVSNSTDGVITFQPVDADVPSPLPQA